MMFRNFRPSSLYLFTEGENYFYDETLLIGNVLAEVILKFGIEYGYL